MEANLVDAKNTKGTDNFKDQIVEIVLHDTINVNEKSDVKLENIEDVKLDTVQLEVPSIKISKNELNNSDLTSHYNMSNDTFTHETSADDLSYNYLCITPSKNETAPDVITIYDDSSVIILLDESQKENSMLEKNQSVDPSKNMNKTHPEEKSFQDSKTNISASDVQENDSNESLKGIESSFISTMENESCVEILDDDRKKRTSLKQTSSAFELSQNSEDLVNTTGNESRVGILENNNKKTTSLNQNSSAFEFSLRLEESFVNTTQNISCAEILDNDIKERASLNQTSATFDSSQHLEESSINTTQNISCVEILDNDNKKRTSLNQTSTSTFESSHSEHPEESFINMTQNESCVEVLEVLDNDIKKRASLNQTSAAFESSQHLQESLINTTQNESCVEILDNDTKKRASLNQTSAALKPSHHPEESLISTTQNESCVEVLDNDIKKRASLNQISTAFESSQHLQESLINTTQNKSCVEILDNDAKKRASLNQTSAVFEPSQHLEESLINTTQNESCVEVLDNDIKKRASLNQTSTAFESSQHLQESFINTTQNISCVEILDNDKKRISLNQTSTSAFESSHSEHPEESLINATQNESCVDALDDDTTKRASLSQTSAAFESSEQLEESLVNTTQNKSCVEILDNNNKKRTSHNQTSSSTFESQHLEESYVDIIDKDNRKRSSLHETPSAFESSQQLSRNDLIDLNKTYPEEMSSDKVITDIKDPKEFPKNDSNESTAEIDKCLVNNSSCSNIVHYQPNESVGSDNKKNTNVNEALPVLESSQKTSTKGSVDGANDLNKTVQEERSFQNPTNTQDSEIPKEEGNSEKLESMNQVEIYTTYEEQIEGRLDASESTNLLNQTFSEGSVKHNRTSTLNSTETDLVMALEALNINCDEKDETFLSCQDAFDESVREENFESNHNATINDFDSSVHKGNTTFELGEKNSKTSIGDEICHPDFESNQNATINNFDSSVHKCNTTLELGEKNSKTSIGDEVFHPENVETEEHSSVASPPNENDNGMRTSVIESFFPTIQVSSPGININENDTYMRNEDIPLNESSETNKNSSSETVIQDDNELDLAAVPDVITPNKPKPRLSEASNDDILIDYNSLLEASPSVFDRRASMFGRQSDLKLYVNELEQRISKLQIQLCKKESIILKQQMAQNCAEKCRKFEENNGQTESEVIKNLCAELEKEKTKIAQMKIAHESDVKKLNQKLSAQEAKLRDHEALTEKYKELEQNNTEIVLKLEKATSDKNKVIELLDKNDNLMAYMSTRNKELVEDKTSLEKKLHNINNAFKEVVGKYEQCKVIIIGLKKNEEIYKGEINELRNVLKRHEEIYTNFKKDAETKLKEASEQITTLQKFKLEAEKAKLPGKRRYK